MAKTYLQLVNKVQVNLRESQTTDLSSPYAQVLGEFVNVAKETVEDTWRWRALTSELQFVTVAGTQAYPLTSGAGATTSFLFPDERAYVLSDAKGNAQAFDITQIASNVIYQLQKVPYESIVADIKLGPARTQNIPWSFAYSTVGGISTAYLTDPPPGSRTVAIRMITPQPEFTAGTETLSVPWRPVVSLATALAMQERGEELGSPAGFWMDRYNSELIRAQENDRESAYDQLLSIGNESDGPMF